MKVSIPIFSIYIYSFLLSSKNGIREGKHALDKVSL